VSGSAEERARLFVALELPLEVREALVGWRDAAVRGLPGMRVLRGEDLHVTLCFLGWQPLSEAVAILRACGVAAACPAAPLAVGSAVWLPPRRPRVLAVALEDRSSALAAVQGVVSAALVEGGWYTPEKRPFLAHVTVARVGRAGGGPRRVGPRGGGPRGGGAASADGMALGDPPSPAFAGSRVTLFRSRLSPAGARYEPLGTVALGRGDLGTGAA
jgi:2'-5' RNA ligase